MRTLYHDCGHPILVREMGGSALCYQKVAEGKPGEVTRLVDCPRCGAMLQVGDLSKTPPTRQEGVQPVNEAEYITTREAAQRLGITPGAVRSLIHAGRLPAHKVGRDWLISPDDLDLVRDRKPGRPPIERLTAEQYRARGVEVVNDKLRLPILRCMVCAKTWTGHDWLCPRGCNAEHDPAMGGPVYGPMDPDPWTGLYRVRDGDQEVTE